MYIRMERSAEFDLTAASDVDCAPPAAASHGRTSQIAASCLHQSSRDISGGMPAASTICHPTSKKRCLEADSDVCPSKRCKTAHDAEHGLHHTIGRSKLLRFSNAAPVIFTWEDNDDDRTCFPPNIFHCDMCHRPIDGGLKGFEIYMSCWVCEEFDCCVDCFESCMPTQEGAVRLLAHRGGYHPFIRVDRNKDPYTSEIECFEAERATRTYNAANELSPFGYEL